MKKLSAFLLPVFIFAMIVQGVFGSVSAVEATNFQDGEYGISVNALKADGSGNSEMNQFMSKRATLIVKGDQNIVQMTLNNADWWKSFVVGGQSVTTVSDKGDTRVVQVNVPNVDQAVAAHVAIDAGDMYKGEHDVTLSFDVSSVPAATEEIEEENEKEDTEAVISEEANNGETTPAKTDDKTPEDNPKTSDTSPIFLLAFALILSGAVLGRKFFFAK